MLRACLIAAAIAATVALLFAGLVVVLGLYESPPANSAPVVFETTRHDWDRDNPAERGANLYQQMCISCHDVKPDDTTEIGPPFYNLYGSERRFTDGTTAIANADYIRESITEPGAKIVEGYRNLQLPFTHLDEREMEYLIAFFRAISENHDEPAEPLDWHDHLLE